MLKKFLNIFKAEVRTLQNILWSLVIKKQFWFNFVFNDELKLSADFFGECVSEQDLDELNIEIIRNTLYKAYLESFYNYCKSLGGTTAEVMCEILAVSGFCFDFLLLQTLNQVIATNELTTIIYVNKSYSGKFKICTNLLFIYPGNDDLNISNSISFSTQDQC